MHVIKAVINSTISNNTHILFQKAGVINECDTHFIRTYEGLYLVNSSVNANLYPKANVDQLDKVIKTQEIHNEWTFKQLL